MAYGVIEAGISWNNFESYVVSCRGWVIARGLCISPYLE